MLIAVGIVFSGLAENPTLLAGIDRSGALTAWIDEHRERLAPGTIYRSSGLTPEDIIGDDAE